jgi:hypothetical protein
MVGVLALVAVAAYWSVNAPRGFPSSHKQVLKVAHHAGITFRQLGRNLVTGNE